MKNDALTPRPKPGDVLALFKRSDFSGQEERLGLRKVERVMPSGRIIIGRYRFGASGGEIGSTGFYTLHVRWPTPVDLADARRAALVRALLDHPWGRETDETREQVAAILKLDVRLP